MDKKGFSGGAGILMTIISTFGKSCSLWLIIGLSAAFVCFGYSIYSIRKWKLISRLFLLLLIAGGLFILGYYLWPDQLYKLPTQINLKIIQPAQFLKDNKEGVYIVIPDVQITNTNNNATVVNIALLIEKENGVAVHYESFSSRIPEIEQWLQKNNLSNSNFLGRQINVFANSGINGYMIFYINKERLQMSGQTIEQLSYSRYKFHIEQMGLKPWNISKGEAIIGRKIK